MTFTVRNQSCTNPDCPFYHQVLKGNVIVHTSLGRRLKCKACGMTWVAHHGTLQYRLRVDSATVQAALALLDQGLSVRETARRLGVSPSTVARWKLRRRFLNHRSDL